MHIIASGSKGNSSVIYDDKTTILVDMGISKAHLSEGLSEIGKKIKDIDFVFYTHNHSDHIKGAEFLPFSKRYARVGTIQMPTENYLEPYKEYSFKSFLVTPLLTSHDAISPCAYLFKNNNETLLYLTDSGCIPETTLKYMRNCDYYFIESNHDVEMLLESERPRSLKNRILGDFGHLSNEQSAEYMVYLVGDKTKSIMLGHLSEECNDPVIAIKTYQNIFASEGVSLKNIRLDCAKQYSSKDLI